MTNAIHVRVEIPDDISKYILTKHRYLQINEKKTIGDTDS